MPIRDFVSQNLWKIAIGLGLITAAVVLWGRSVVTPLPVAQSAAPPTSTGTATFSRATRSQTATPVALLPTKTATLAPPTATFTPVPVYYQVQSGDVPLAIAASYDITVAELLAANEITDPTLLQIGQELLIPVTATPSPTAPTPTLTPSVTPSPTPEPITYTIQSGDSLGKIAAEFDVSLNRLMLVNNLSGDDILQIGRQLTIPTGEEDSGVPSVIHIIDSGDTFLYLSFFYGSTVDDILAANPGMEPQLLQIGQKVIIPVTSPPINPNANPALPQIIIPSDIPASLADLPVQMFNTINAQREAAGLPAYQSDAVLVQMALAHAQDMIARGYFSHTTPEGVTLDDRFVINQVDAHWTGENIQRNVKPLDKTVAEAIRWFMSSTVHRGNILHNRFNKIGVGVAEGPPGWYTFVLVFAER